MNSRSILDYADIMSIIANKPLGAIGKPLLCECSNNLCNSAFSREENNNNNNSNTISPKLLEAISSDMILFDVYNIIYI